MKLWSWIFGSVGALGLAFAQASSESLEEASPEELAAQFSEQERAGEIEFADALAPRMDPELAALLRAVPDAPEASTRAVLEVFKRPQGLGIETEFALLTVDGQLKNVFVVSTAKPGKYTIEGTYTLKIPRVRNKPYPWLRSSKYQNSPMFWGLHIRGGYFTHSTPHYGELGRPASMGCVRLTFPSAMELFDEVVNRVSGSAIVKIYGSGSREASAAFAAKRLDLGWLRSRVEGDLADAHAITRGDYNGMGHAREGQSLAWPSCEDVDCFDYFRVRRPNL